MSPDISHLYRYLPVRPPSQCWLWVGSKIPSGYGRMRLGHRLIYAHRHSYILHVGPIPQGSHVLHKCDTPACCNPDHLFLGTAKDNSDDKRQKLRKQRKITGEQAIAIYSDGRTCKAIADDFGVSRDLVEKIKNGSAWSDVTGAQKRPNIDQWAEMMDARSPSVCG